jgi:hypothetical protein
MATSDQIHAATRQPTAPTADRSAGYHLMAVTYGDQAYEAEERARAAAAVRRLAPPDLVETVLEALGLAEVEPAPPTRCGPIQHGTYAGWMAHRRRGIPICDECRAAHNAYRRERHAAARREGAS